MESLILGNGPSLNTLFTADLYSHPSIFACNRIFLHPYCGTFAKNTTLFLSDLSFSTKYNSMISVLTQFKSVMVPEDFHWPNDGNLFTYKLTRGRHDYFKSTLADNINHYPFVCESCSVLFTILLPYIVNTYDLRNLRFLGFDGSYSKGKYFYDSQQNKDYRWSQSQESEWANDFKNEMTCFLMSYSHILPSVFQ